MSTDSRKRSAKPPVDGVGTPLAPLNCHEVDWVEVYGVYTALPPREREVLDLLVGGRLQQQIACQLSISHETVRVHCASIRKKFSVSSLPNLVRIIICALYEEARRVETVSRNTDG